MGSQSKLNSPAYVLDAVYKIQVTLGEEDDIIPVPVKDFTSKENDYNISHEFSLNWSKDVNKGGIIQKQKYEIKPKYASLVDKYKTKKKTDIDEFDEETDSHHGELSILGIHDPDSKYIQKILQKGYVQRKYPKETILG